MSRIQKTRSAAVITTLVLFVSLVAACSKTPDVEPTFVEATTDGAGIHIGTTPQATKTTSGPVDGELVKTPTASAISQPGETLEQSATRYELYLPKISKPESPTETPEVVATPTPSPTKKKEKSKPTTTPFVTVDFAKERAELLAVGQEIGFVKIGFHVGVGGTARGLGDWMRRLDEAGVPFFLKCVDYAGPIFEAQGIMQNSDVPHTLVYRSTGDVPHYDLSPEEAARIHWEEHRALFPPELDPSLVWLETINEVDQNRSEWLAQFALATAQMTMAEGYRWAAFSWSAGEPRIEVWSMPNMLAFLRLVGQNPEHLAIALHEYSFTNDDIAFEYPYRVGHFLHLFQVCDQNGIPRPTVLITEWGWEYNDVPSSGKAMQHISWAAELYAPFETVKGVAIWHLGGGGSFSNIAKHAEKLIEPVTLFSLSHYYPAPLPPEKAPADPELYRP